MLKKLLEKLPLQVQELLLLVIAFGFILLAAYVFRLVTPSGGAVMAAWATFSKWSDANYKGIVGFGIGLFGLWIAGRLEAFLADVAAIRRDVDDIAKDIRRRA
jgi:hypothetical protein